MRLRRCPYCPDQEILYFDEGEAESALENARQSNLVAFFQQCAANRSSEMRCADVPSFCRWDSRRHEWILKSLKTDSIGRLAMATPGPNSERFYIRQLLLNVTSPKLFGHLRTVDGVLKETFHEACIALGIVVDDQIYRRCLREIESVLSAFQSRKLFARILAYCYPSSPVALWDVFKSPLMADFLHLLSQPVCDDPRRLWHQLRKSCWTVARPSATLGWSSTAMLTC